MSYRKTLISIAISGLFAASGTAIAHECESQIDSFEEQLSSAELNETQSDQLEEYVSSARELAENDKVAVCQEMVANMNSLLAEYTKIEVAATAEAEINDEQSWDLNDDGESLEQEAETAYESTADEIEETGDEIDAAGDQLERSAESAAVAAFAVTAAELNDAEIVDSSGEEIAEFEGFVKHLQSGETYVVAEIDDGWFSERDVVLPASEFSLNAEGNLVYNGTMNLEDVDDLVEADFEMIEQDQSVTQLSR